jgi:hypothetical protein
MWGAVIVAALTTAAAHTSAITREARTLSTEAPLTAQDDYEAANDRVLLRVLWIRHGLSCANVLDSCSEDFERTENLTSAAGPAAHWRRAAAKVLADQRPGVSIDWEWGLKPRGWVDARGDVSPDCVLRLVGLPSLSPMKKISTATGRCTTTANASGPTEEQVCVDQQARPQMRRLMGALGNDGDVVRLHDLYQDPSLTTCSVHQSRVAGSVFRAFLRERGWRLDLVASSTLLRAVQTAFHMFVEEHQEKTPQKKNAHFDLRKVPQSRHTMIVQLPFINERAPAAMTAVQLDNLPSPSREQLSRISRGVHVDTRFVEAPKRLSDWAKPLLDLVRPQTITTHYPRDGHSWERFKAFLALELLPAIVHQSSAGRSKIPPSVTGAAGSRRKSPLQAGVAERIVGGSIPALGGAKITSASIAGEAVGSTYTEGPGILQPEVYAAEKAHSFDRVLTIAVVGHGAMIRKHCLRDAVAAAEGIGASVDGRVESKVKVNNNAVYEKLFVIERSANGAQPGSDATPTTRVVLREALGDCALVMDAPKREDSMSTVSRDDVASCSVPFDVAPFLNLTDNVSPTTCEAAADKPGAFPIEYHEREAHVQ